jgi:predicted ATPase/DNA-binding SARP family transcriptional activator
MSCLRLYLLGPPRAECTDGPCTFDRRKAMALLAYLAVTATRHPRDTLATLFWPELDQSRAHAALRRTLVALKQGVGEGWLDVDRETIGLDGDRPPWTDVARFHECLAAAQAHDHPQDRSCSACLAALSEAAVLYRGDFMAGFTLRDSPGFDDWQREQGEHLRCELAGALETLSRGYAAQGDMEAAIAYARRWLSLDPLREAAHRQLMRLYAQSGQRAAAIAQYRACRDLLRRELALSPSQETARLYRQIRENRLPPVPPVQAVPPSHLPQQATPFVGREAELADIARHLADPGCRLLTLAGPGGIGKTRLAIEAAIAQSGCFTHGVYFVPLAAVRSAGLIVPTIAEAIGFTFGAGTGEADEGLDPAERAAEAQLLDHLWDKEMLLVLDNVEHLAAGAAFLAETLAAAPRIKLLVTSRERLNLRAEWPYEVQGLAVPGEGVADGMTGGGDAVALFLSTARRIEPGFAGDRADMARICRLLGGMPLAIELAASWAHVLSCTEIADQVAEAMAGGGLGFFDAAAGPGPRDLPDRHRSMQAVFAHSWDLLFPSGQSALANLSVFRGSFDRDAAAEVGSASLATLSALVDKSLLQRSRPAGASDRTRYELHELLRQFATEKLGSNREPHERHSRYYAAYLAEQEVRLKGPDQALALAEIEREIDNVRAAWEWATAHRACREIGLALESLYRFYEIRSRYQEGRAAFEGAIDALEAAEPGDPLLLGRLLARLGRLTHHTDDLERAEALLEQALATLRTQDAPAEVGWVLLWLGETVRRQGARARSRSLLREALAMGREAGDTELEAGSLTSLAGWTTAGAAYEEARALYRRGLTLYRSTGNRRGMADALYGLGHIATYLREWDVSKRLYEESMAIREQLGDRRGVAWCLHFMAENARGQGRYTEARRLYECSLAIHRALGDPLRTYNVLQRMSTVVLWLGDVEALEEISHEIHVHVLRLGNPFYIACSLEGLGEVAQLKGETAQARQYYEGSLAIGYEIEHPRVLAWSLMGLGDADYATGAVDAARMRYEQSLAICREHEVEDGIPMSLLRLGDAVRTTGDVVASRRYMVEALQFEVKRGHAGAITRVLSHMVPLLKDEARVQEALMLAAYLLQRPETQEPERGQVRQQFEALAAQFPPEQAAAIRQACSARTLDEVCELALLESGI